MKTIVVGYNESDPSDRAIERDGEMARLYGARLVVTSVVPVLIGGERGDDGSDLRNAGSLLERMGLEAELVEAVGDPAEAIVEVAEANQADLIVVGTREPSMVERGFCLVSVSESVQRRAHGDVLIVH